MHLYLGSLKYAAKECILLQASVICSKINRCREQDSTLHLLILKLNQAPEYGSSFQIFAKLSVANCYIENVLTEHTLLLGCTI